MTALEPLFVDTVVFAKAIDWRALVKAGPPWHGAIIKASEGVYFDDVAFPRHWKAIRDCAEAEGRYGVDFWRGAYGYLLIRGSGENAKTFGRLQAEAYARGIERAGGWGTGDLLPIVDVEEGSSNRDASPAAIIDTTSAYIERIRELTGRASILYAGWWLTSNGIKTRFGAEWLWYASYTKTLEPVMYERIGWDAASLWGWQFGGADGQGVYAQREGYPRTTPIGNADISSLRLPGGLQAMRSRLWAEAPSS